MASAQAAREVVSRSPSGAVVALPRPSAKPKKPRSPIMRCRSRKKRDPLQEAIVVPLRPENAPEQEEAEKKRVRCQLFGYMLRGKPLSLDEESWDFERAWETAMQYGRATRYFLRRYGMLPCKKQDKGDVLALGLAATVLAALTHDPAKGSFLTHLSHQMKQCIRPHFEVKGLAINLPNQRVVRAHGYSMWRGGHMGASLEDFAREKGITPEEARKRAADYHLMQSSFHPLDGHEFFNGISREDDSEQAAFGNPIISSARDRSSIAENPDNFGSHESIATSIDYLKVSTGLEFIIGELIKGERDRKILWMRFEEEMSLEDIGEHFGVSRERIRQILQRCLMELRNSEYGDELHEYLSSFC